MLSSMIMSSAARLLLLISSVSLLVQTAAGETITVYGAAGRVSGSLAVLETGQHRWMIDCGIFYPEGDDRRADREEQAARQSTVLPADAASVAALFLTHAHLDHIGRVPLLVEQGFKGPIYLTRPTAELAEPMLLMQVRFDRQRVRTWVWSKAAREKAAESGRSLYVHWRACKYRKNINDGHLETDRCCAAELAEWHRERQPAVKTFLCQRCAEDEVASICRLFRPLEYDKPTEIAPGVIVTLIDAGHIPGSASVLFETPSAGGKRRILFSGDLGNDLSPLFSGPKPAPAADTVILETTYGTTHRDQAVDEERAAFRRSVGEAVRSGSVVWIPAFTLDRTQKILYELQLAQREGLLARPTPIYCPSPTARTITGLYEKHQHDGWFRDDVAADPGAWQPSEVRKTVPSDLPRPAILISPSDMTTALWSQRLLTRLLPEPTTHIFLVGYQDPQGEGGQLAAGVRQLEVLGKSIRVQAQVRSFGCFSGHGDAADLDRWLANVPRDVPILLVHGGAEELRSRAAQLRAAGRANVQIARPGESFPSLERN